MRLAAQTALLMKVTITARVDPHVLDKLQELATLQNRSLSAVASKILSDAVVRKVEGK